jgi:ArsR family transcriptional regulator
VDDTTGPTLHDELDTDAATELATTFKALADPVRLRLLSLVASAEGGEVCVCDLPEQVDRSQPTVSHHLTVLTEAGLVTREQRGRWAWFAADQRGLRALRMALGD